MSAKVGDVVLGFTEPTLAYETEFADAEGRTVAQLALHPGQIRHRTRGAARVRTPVPPLRNRHRNGQA